MILTFPYIYTEAIEALQNACVFKDKATAMSA